jgi:hypothetical protein
VCCVRLQQIFSFIYEATFRVCVCVCARARATVNRHSRGVCGSGNPHDVTEHVSDSPKINVWYALLRNQSHRSSFRFENQQ